MKNLILLMALAGITSPSAAQTLDRGTYKRVQISEQDAASVTVTLTQTFETVDGCNSFGVFGDFYSLQLNAGETRLYTPYLADIGVAGTEIGCSDLPEPRQLTVSLDRTFLASQFGGVYLDLLYPDAFELSVAVD